MSLRCGRRDEKCASFFYLSIYFYSFFGNSEPIKTTYNPWHAHIKPAIKYLNRKGRSHEAINTLIVKRLWQTHDVHGLLWRLYPKIPKRYCVLRFFYQKKQIMQIERCNIQKSDEQLNAQTKLNSRSKKAKVFAQHVEIRARHFHGTLELIENDEPPRMVKSVP